MSEILRLPGFVDVHTHLREPGDNKAETIKNGSRAAMLGGFVLICDMPNNPGRPTWTEERLDEKIEIAERDAIIPIRFYAGSQPESDNIGELEGMAKKAFGLKLYGAPTTGNENDYEASDFAEIVGEWHRVAPDKPILLHAGRNNLADMIGLVAQNNDHRLHVCHVNSIEEVERVDQAKSYGLPVTSGVTPHALFKTSHDVITGGWMMRMQPPLPTQIVGEELWHALVNGRIDKIESDYAPHPIDAKLKAEMENPHGVHDPHHTTCFGVPGIEHIGPLLLRQMNLGNISAERLVEVMITNPRKMLGLAPTDKKTYVEWDMDTYIIGQDSVQSGSEWSPYTNSVGVGKVSRVVVNGNLTYEREAA